MGSELFVVRRAWRRWESKTADFDANHATTGNQRKPDPEPPESRHEEKQFRETPLPSGETEAETRRGRADEGTCPPPTPRALWRAGSLELDGSILKEPSVSAI